MLAGMAMGWRYRGRERVDSCGLGPIGVFRNPLHFPSVHFGYRPQTPQAFQAKSIHGSCEPPRRSLLNRPNRPTPDAPAPTVNDNDRQPGIPAQWLRGPISLLGVAPVADLPDTKSKLVTEAP